MVCRAVKRPSNGVLHLTTLPQAGEQRTMSSQEIADLTGKQHGHVMRDIRAMLAELGGDQSRFGAVYRNAKGEERACYRLPYDETMILVTGYSIPLRAAVVRRWRELEEAKPALPDFSNPGRRCACLG